MTERVLRLGLTLRNPFSDGRSVDLSDSPKRFVKITVRLDIDLMDNISLICEMLKISKCTFIEAALLDACILSGSIVNSEGLRDVFDDAIKKGLI